MPTSPPTPNNLGPIYRQGVVNGELEKAFKRGRWLVCIVSVEDGKMELHRATNNFPHGDLPGALELIRKDLERIGTPAGPGIKV